MRKSLIFLTLCLAAGLWNLPFLIPDSSQRFPETYSIQGESLIHGLKYERFFGSEITENLPLASTLAAIFSTHGPLSEKSFLLGSAWLWWLLVFCVGTLLGSWRGGVCAAALFAAGLGSGESLLALEPRAFYGLFILLTGGFLILEARNPTTWNRLLLALSMGISFNFRSPLAFFPPLWAAFRIVSLRQDKNLLRRNWKALVLTAAIPYLFTLPWASMSSRLSGKTILFEEGRGNGNIIAGALGLPLTFEGNWQPLLETRLENNDRSSLFQEAVQIISRHPLRYVWGVVLRLVYVFLMHPFLYLLALFAAWRFWKEKEIRPLVLLGAYYLGIHCFFAAESGYFKPMLPLLALLASMHSGWPGFPLKTPPLKVPAAILSCVLVLFLALDAWTLFLVNGYPGKSRVNRLEALRKNTVLLEREAWANVEMGRQESLRGNLRGAAEFFSKALKISGAPAHQLELAGILALQGLPHELASSPLIIAPLCEEACPEKIQLHLWETAAFLRRSETKKADEALKKALKEWKSFSCGFRDQGTVFEPPWGKEIYSRLPCIRNEEFAAEVLSRYFYGPPQDRASVLKHLTALYQNHDPSWISLAQERALAGEYILAEILLERLSVLKAGGTAWSSALPALHAMEPSRRIPLLKKLIKNAPGEPVLWAELAAEFSRRSLWKNAASALSHLKNFYFDASLWRQIALEMQNAREYSLSLELLNEVIRRDDGDGGSYSDRGVGFYLAGRKDDAERDFRKAIALNPNFLPAHASLIALLTERGDYAGTMRVYENALRAQPAPEHLPILESIRQNRAILKSGSPKP